METMETMETMEMADPPLLRVDIPGVYPPEPEATRRGYWGYPHDDAPLSATDMQRRLDAYFRVRGHLWHLSGDLRNVMDEEWDREPDAAVLTVLNATLCDVMNHAGTTLGDLERIVAWDIDRLAARPPRPAAACDAARAWARAFYTDDTASAGARVCRGADPFPLEGSAVLIHLAFPGVFGPPPLPHTLDVCVFATRAGEPLVYPVQAERGYHDPGRCPCRRARRKRAGSVGRGAGRTP